MKSQLNVRLIEFSHENIEKKNRAGMTLIKTVMNYSNNVRLGCSIELGLLVFGTSAYSLSSFFSLLTLIAVVDASHNVARELVDALSVIGETLCPQTSFGHLLQPNFQPRVICVQSIFQLQVISVQRCQIWFEFAETSNS